MSRTERSATEADTLHRSDAAEAVARVVATSGWYGQVIGPGELHCNHVVREVVRTRTRFQQVEILDLDPFGRCLLLDGVLQTAERDEFVYHEALVHPAMTTHPEPRRVLVLGGGEGATLREVLRHPTVERAVMVDIDGELVELCKRHLPAWSAGAFDDPRAEVRYTDGRAYLERTDERFDLIVGDLTDPLEAGIAAELYGEAFYGRVRRALGPGGLYVTQGYGVRYAATDALFERTYRGLARAFPRVSAHLEFVGSFDLNFGFFVASERALPTDLDAAEVSRRLAARGLAGLRYYDAETHTRLCALPKNVRELLGLQHV